jgi:phage-related tail protein
MGKDQESQKTIDEIAKNEILLAQQNGNVLSLANQVTEKQQNVNKTQEEIQKTQELYDKLINLQLAHVGINATGAEGIGQLDQAIQKTQTRIDELNAAKQSQGGLNTEQQTELTNLQNALGQYQAAKNEIGNIQGQQQGVNARIDEGTGKARNMNNELGKHVNKDVSVDDQGGADDLNKKVSEAKKKQVTIEAIWTGAKAALHAIGVPGFAVGTDFAPGGWSLVGEQGPELMYVPRGSQIKTASETRRLTNGSSGIETVKTRGDINVQIYPQKAIIEQKDIVRELQRMEALYGG